MVKVYKLEDYKALDYLVEHVQLEIDLTKTPVQEKSILTIIPNPHSHSHAATLKLDGEKMILKAISLNGKALPPEEYEVSDESLIIKNIPQDKRFTLETTTILSEHSDLFGLYKTEGTLLVKAETEGLRRVLYCNDRPDNLATYTTTIIANKKQYPTLLSNGLKIKEEDLGNDIHAVTWKDDFPKPSYLFALIAGNLQESSTSYTTQSGREIPIKFYVPEEAAEKCDFAKDVLTATMKWDEEICKLDCPLPLMMVAGVDKYASGASEPTGLILFNTANLYATYASRTDNDILRVFEVVAHEFAHTRTGNLTTIRDWFNLTVKEGLATFRAAQFLEYLFGTDLIRMLHGKNLDERAPRPNSYTAVRSLYTAAAYEKSADIFRMIMLMVGDEMFREKLALFLDSNLGKAVTLEELIHSLSESTGINLNPFLKWFTESGIPEVKVSDHYDAENSLYTLKFELIGAKERPIPIEYGLLDSAGKEILADVCVFDKSGSIILENITSHPTPSLLRSFSAPVHLNFEYSTEQLLLLIQHDTNVYNRCEAAKQLISKYCTGEPIEFTAEFFNTYRSLFTDSRLNLWLLAELLQLPSEESIIANANKPDFEKIALARKIIQHKLATELKTELHSILQIADTVKQPETPTLFDMDAAGMRRLKSVCYSYLLAAEPKNTERALITQFHDALGVNMTETISALTLLADINSTQLDTLLQQFYSQWQHDNDAMNYWFKVQASAHSDKVVERVERLMLHPSFDATNPNKVYALLGTFMNNPYGFHAASGEGYKLVAKFILNLEPVNPTLAASLTDKFSDTSKYDEHRKKMILNSLHYIYTTAKTDDVRNMAKK